MRQSYRIFCHANEQSYVWSWTEYDAHPPNPNGIINPAPQRSSASAAIKRARNCNIRCSRERKSILIHPESSSRRRRRHGRRVSCVWCSRVRTLPEQTLTHEHSGPAVPPPPRTHVSHLRVRSPCGRNGHVGHAGHEATSAATQGHLCALKICQTQMRRTSVAHALRTQHVHVPSAWWWRQRRHSDTQQGPSTNALQLLNIWDTSWMFSIHTQKYTI